MVLPIDPEQDVKPDSKELVASVAFGFGKSIHNWHFLLCLIGSGALLLAFDYVQPKGYYTNLRLVDGRQAFATQLAFGCWEQSKNFPDATIHGKSLIPGFEREARI